MTSFEKNKEKVVNYWKLIYIPTLITFFTIVVIGCIILFSSKNFIINQMRENAVTITNRATEQVISHYKALEMIDEIMERRIEVAGELIIRNRENLSPDFLENNLKNLDVTELHWIDSDGVILYSTIDIYTGWKAYNGHPLYEFINSDEIKMMEDIRPDDILSRPIKYGALKTSDGYFVQVGIEAEKINELTNNFGYQKIVESLFREENIEYALFVDTTLKVQAHNNIESVGKDYSQDKIIAEAFEGRISETEFFYEGTGKRVYDIAVPVYLEEQFIGVFNIGFSMEEAYKTIYSNSLFITILSIAIFILFWRTQHKNVITPVIELEESLKKIDIENNIMYKLSVSDEDTFAGLKKNINAILDKTSMFFYRVQERQEEINKSKEEISIAYDRLKASDNELRKKYEEIKKHKAFIEHIAEHDELTNLPNRRRFMKVLNDELRKGSSGAVMLLDLDNFKEINDTLGHVYGDNVLKEIAKILKKLSNDKIEISRFGGDEFLIYIKDESEKVQIGKYASQIAEMLKDEISLNGSKINISFSMGITRFPEDTSDIDQLIINADTAMYKVKESGKNNFIFFDQSMLSSEFIEIEITKNILLEEDYHTIDY